MKYLLKCLLIHHNKLQILVRGQHCPRDRWRYEVMAHIDLHRKFCAVILKSKTKVVSHRACLTRCFSISSTASFTFNVRLNTLLTLCNIFAHKVNLHFERSLWCFKPLEVQYVQTSNMMNISASAVCQKENKVAFPPIAAVQFGKPWPGLCV